MTTLDDLTNEVHLNLLGFVLDQEQLTLTAGAVTPTDVSFSVDDATQMSPGLIEVGDELMWCTRVDPDSNVVYVAIRGMYGSEAATHAADAVVRNQPRFPRFSIVRAIRATIASMYPDVYAVSTTTVVFTGAVSTYELPAVTDDVYAASWENIGPGGDWVPLHYYRLDKHADTGTYPSGVTLEVQEGIVPGRTITITYRHNPVDFDENITELTDTGLAESAREAIVYGACARLVGYTEPARMSDDSAEARFMGLQTAGSAVNASRYFYSLYLQAKAEESRRLLDRYPARMNFQR